MNKALSVSIGLSILVAVAYVSYRIWDEQTAADAATIGEAVPENDGDKRAPIDAALDSLSLPRTEQLLSGEDETHVSGIVLLPDGLPASGARLTLYRALSPWPEWQREPLDTVYTSVGGKFRFQIPRGPDLLVSFEHPESAGDLVQADPRNPSLTLRLEPGFEVTGFVQSNVGAGVADATVTLEPTFTDTRRARTATTDASGYFLFTNVRAGSVRVVARHPLWQPAVLPLVTVGASQGLDLAFEEEALVLEGRVVAAATGEAVHQAEVRALPNTVYRGLFDPRIAFTGEDGTFRLQGLGRGNLRLEVRHPDYSTVSRPIAVSPSSTAPLFELTPRSQVRGRLVGYTELVPDEREVTLLLRNTAGDMERAVVQADGSFGFSSSFSAGPATLEIESGILAFERTSSFDTQVRIEDVLRTELLLDVVAPSVLLGRVVGPGGDPVAGARIALPQEYQKLLAPERLIDVTDEAGDWRVRGLPAGTIVLLVAHDDYASQRITLEVPVPGATKRAPDVVLERPGSISGRVTRGRRPLAGALVSVTSGTTTAQTVSLEPDGSFLLQGLPPGDYRVRARYSTLPLALADRQAEVRPGEVVGPITLEFEAGRTVVGRVLGSDDQPVEGAVVTVLQMAGAGSITATDSSGRFSLEVSRRRRVEIQAFLGDRTFNTTAVLEPHESEVVLRLDTPPTATLVADVYGLPGRKQLPGGFLRIAPEGGPSITRYVEMSGGELRHPWFPAGSSRVTLQCEGYAPFVREVVLKAGEELDLDTILLEPGSTLAGLVVDRDGRPVPGAEVLLGEETDLDLFKPQTHTAPDGTFRLPGVSTRSRQLVVSAPGYATRTVELELPRDVLRTGPYEVVLDEGARIEVQVLEADGRPREGGFVLLLRKGRVLTYADIGEDGVAVFLHRAQNTYGVQLFGQSERYAEVEVTDAGETYRVVLR